MEFETGENPQYPVTHGEAKFEETKDATLVADIYNRDRRFIVTQMTVTFKHKSSKDTDWKFLADLYLQPYQVLRIKLSGEELNFKPKLHERHQNDWEWTYNIDKVILITD